MEGMERREREFGEILFLIYLLGLRRILVVELIDASLDPRVLRLNPRA